MYKRKKKSYWKKFNYFVAWLKRRIMIIMTAFMLGMSNVIYEEDKMIDGNQNYIEQAQQDDEEDTI